MCKYFQCPKSNYKYGGRGITSIKLLHIYCKTIFPVCVQHEESISAFQCSEYNLSLHTGYLHTSFVLHFI